MPGSELACHCHPLRNSIDRGTASPGGSMGSMERRSRRLLRLRVVSSAGLAIVASVITGLSRRETPAGGGRWRLSFDPQTADLDLGYRVVGSARAPSIKAKRGSIGAHRLKIRRSSGSVVPPTGNPTGRLRGPRHRST